MSQTFEDDDLRPDEYDFTKLPVVARGQGRKRSTLIQLDPDVEQFFQILTLLMKDYAY